MIYHNQAIHAAAMSTSPASAVPAAVSSGYTAFQPHKRQRLGDESPPKDDAGDAHGTTDDKSTLLEGAESSSEIAAKNNANASLSYANMPSSIQKETSWSTMLGDVDSFGGLGPIPSMHSVLEKRASSQFSISSLLPPMGMSSVVNQTDAANHNARFDQPSADSLETSSDADHNAQAAAAHAKQLPHYAEGSGGNQKYMDATTGEYMYPDNVKPMTFYDKQRLVQKITLLPSQYLRGLMDVISKYQPDTVRQVDDDGYAFDLGQMNENTVWAISDYVKDSMIELDGYIKSISSSSIIGDDGQSVSMDGQTLAGISQANAEAHASADITLNNPKISAISVNENQGKFMEQVEMYSRPKITKSRVKPSKKHECPTCNKQFRGRSELQNHIRTHTGEKPLKCSYAGCTKRYAHSSNLRAHERTHAGVKPYACHYDGCGKSFAHSVSLKEHIWMHAGFQPYVCPYEGCEKKFTQVSNFARHKKTHEKEERSENDEQSVESDN